jgi:hypothetical protein
VKDQGHQHQTHGSDQQRDRQAQLAGDQAPAQAAQGHGTVEYHQVDGKTPAAHPVGQHRLGHAVERGQRNNPAQTQHQHQRHGSPLGRRQGQHAHDQGRHHRSQQHQTVGIEALAQLGQQHGAQDGSGAHSAQHHTVETGRAAQHAARHQGSRAQTELANRKNTAARSNTTCSSRRHGHSAHRPGRRRRTAR